MKGVILGGGLGTRRRLYRLEPVQNNISLIVWSEHESQSINIYSFPSALVLYWLCSICFQLLQQVIENRLK